MIKGDVYRAMRDILFRAKAINRDPDREYRTNYKNGDWVYGIVSRLYNEICDLPAEMTNNDGVSGIEVDHNTIGMWTGFYDKEGTKIFEDDILMGDEYPFYDGDNKCYNYFAMVYWFEDNAAFGLMTVKNPKSKVRGISDGISEYFEEFNPDNWLVIGNIYDNPELIERTDSDGKT